MRRLFSFQDGMQLLSSFGVVAGMMISSLAMSTSSHAGTVTFGSGANTFNMEFVTIGNPGNASDSGAGSVSYTYGIGKFEVSEDMINKYNAEFGNSNSLVITKDTRGVNKPATSVSWNEAARFVNWLNTSTGYQAAYKFTSSGVNDNIALWTSGDAGFNASNPFRNSLAKYVLPSFDEWYKAAYYNPSTTSYFSYPSSDGSVPTAVTGGVVDKTAVYNQSPFQGPADVDNAGGLSALGVMGLGGNVWEWEETSYDRTNSSSTLTRGQTGGYWLSSAISLTPLDRSGVSPTTQGLGIGFRVASVGPSGGGEVPEPTSMAIFGLGALGMAYRARRKAKTQA